MIRTVIPAFGALSLTLFTAVILLRPVLPGDPVLNDALLWHALLPRSVVALLAGAMLGLAGALLQRVLRNPIADPSTLGITAGAQLALTLASLFAPALIGFSREAVALAGGMTAAGLVVALSWRRGLDPVTVILSGMMLSLIAAAISAALILARGDYVMSLFIWGAGSLHQQNWQSALALTPRLVLAAGLAVLLLRPLTLLGLDDRGAKSLGFATHGFRLLVLALAVWLAASVTAEVGIIGFVGLAAPAVARLCGARTPSHMLLLAPLLGALILSLTDSAVQLLGTDFTDLAPTGAATALLGGPLLLWLLPRLRPTSTPTTPTPAAPGRRRRDPLRGLFGLFGLLFVLAGLALLVGRDAAGWHVATGPLLADLLPFRGPRLLAAGAAGAMLAAAGTLIQRMTGNPMGSPEVLGVSAGGGVGLAVMLVLVTFPNPALMVGGMALGALVTLFLILALAARSGLRPERLLLAGIAVGAFCMAILTTVLANGGMQGYILLTWMVGSTNTIGSFEASIALAAALLLITPLPILARWLDILPLGSGTARSLGLPLRTSRLILALFAALLTAIASMLVGPLSLIGLIAPHLAGRLGFHRAHHHLLAALLLGAGLLVLADWLARMVIFPYQVPVGLFAALIGGPYLIWLLNHGAKHRA